MFRTAVSPSVLIAGAAEWPSGQIGLSAGMSQSK